MKVDINRVIQLHNELKAINSVPFDELEFVDGDTSITVKPEVSEKWKYIGLNNTDFIVTGFYKLGVVDSQA